MASDALTGSTQIGPDEVFYHGAGCHHCEGLGIHGRVAVYELMTITPAIRELIVPHCAADAIQAVALREGMVSIAQNALALARAGTIPLSEVFGLRAGDCARHQLSIRMRGSIRASSTSDSKVPRMVRNE